MKYVYLFGSKITQGNASQTNILGGKGANLAEMSHLNIPVPPGFTISTDVCNLFLNKQKFNQQITKEIKQALIMIENTIHKIRRKNFYAWNDGNCTKYWFNYRNDSWFNKKNK